MRLVVRFGCGFLTFGHTLVMGANPPSLYLFTVRCKKMINFNIENMFESEEEY